MVGCGGEPPDKEIQQAQGALDAAAAAGADTYATDEFAAARLALENAKAAVDQRDYRLALNHALDSRERAQTAAKEAADNKAIARGAAERALAAGDTTIADAQAKLAAAEERKVAARSLSEPRAVISTAAKRLQEARATFEQGMYAEIPAQVDAATASLVATADELETLKAPPVRRRR